MTRYVCSWCGRRSRGESLSVCTSCTGPLEHADLAAEQRAAAREKLRKAMLIKLDEQPPVRCTPPPRKPPADPPRPKPPPLPPPTPRKPKPLVLRSPPPTGSSTE